MADKFNKEEGTVDINILNFLRYWTVSGTTLYLVTTAQFTARGIIYRVQDW